MSSNHKIPLGSFHAAATYQTILQKPCTDGCNRAAQFKIFLEKTCKKYCQWRGGKEGKLYEASMYNMISISTDSNITTQLSRFLLIFFY